MLGPDLREEKVTLASNATILDSTVGNIFRGSCVRIIFTLRMCNLVCLELKIAFHCGSRLHGIIISA